MQRQTAGVERVDVQTVERHEHGRRARLVGGAAIEKVKLLTRFLVNTHLAV